MVKKLSHEQLVEEQREESLLEYLIRVAKPVTRLDIKKAGFEGDRKTLRELERQGMVKKEEHYFHGKKNKEGKIISGTRYYIYSIVE